LSDLAEDRRRGDVFELAVQDDDVVAVSLRPVRAYCPIVPWLEVPDEPLDDNHGQTRGTPIGRSYIHDFLSGHRDVIRGAVLEVGDDRYTRVFGDGQVTKATVLDIDPTNTAATLLADLSVSGSLPTAEYDCIILTEVLHLLMSPSTALTNCFDALVPGGTLLLTVPVLKRLAPSDARSDYWRFTPAGTELLLARHWRGTFTVASYGNLRACVNFLLAHVEEEVNADDLMRPDPRFPLTVTAAAQKP
jgi:hypothetical protein